MTWCGRCLANFISCRASRRIFDYGDAHFGESQNQNSRPTDEVISVYEIYVKDEETVNPDGKIDTSVLQGLSSSSGCTGDQLIQGDCVVELDEALESELIGSMIAVEKLNDKEPGIKYKIIHRNPEEDKFLTFSQTTNHTQIPGATRLVDKDDPRSRLHFVKYLKREGKTLKIWECGICSKEFRHQYTLMRHLPTHTDERNFRCDTCGKAFRQLSTLSQHRAIHSDARPYICEYCKKTFNRVSTLISHRKTHSDDKPHKCQMCGKGFHQKGNLRNHVFTHTNERPYKCGLCGKGFNQMSNLMCHKMKSHANVEKSLPYACTICGKKFLRRFALRSHEEYKHGIKYSQTKSNPLLADEPAATAADPKNSDLGQTQVACISSSSSAPDGSSGNAEGMIIVDAIQTKAMQDVLSLGQTPFALFKPAKGIPILVKVSPAPPSTSEGLIAHGKQILNPATPEDLKLAGKMCLSPVTPTNDPDGVKEVQIKVPVVATITQTLDSSGSFNYFVETPGPDQDQESHMIETQFSYSDLGGQISPHDHPTISIPNDEDPVVGKGPVDFAPFSPDDDVRYIRATEDGRYEMMTNTEAIDLMAQNNHDVTILNDVEVASMSFDDHQSATNRGDKSLGGVSSHKNIIESFGDKDFRILGPRSELDRFSSDDHISLLEQSKIEDFILGGSRSLVNNSDIPNDDNGCFSIDPSSFRINQPNDLSSNELQLFSNGRRQSSGIMSFFNQLQNLG